MSEAAIAQALSEATEEVLSTMFFTLVDAAPAASPGAAFKRIRITFRGRVRGALILSSSAEATAEMAASFLGLNAAAGPEQEAVAMELANMICGAVLSRLEQSEVFELGSPEMLEAGDGLDANARPGSQVAEQAYQVGSGLLQLKFQLDGLP